MSGMLRRAWMELAYQNRGPLKPAAALLSPLSHLYGAIAKRKRSGASHKETCGLPVISVGNLTVGGSGKTPLVHYLARILQAQGRRPGVLLRGYKRHSNQTLVVTPETFEPGRVNEYGDEAALYVFRHGLPVGVAANRANAARMLTAQSDCDIVLLDDGFQHYQFHRDVDLVLLNGDNPFGNGLCLPFGPLREPAAAAAQADAIIVRGGDIDLPMVEAMPLFQGGFEWLSITPYTEWRQRNFDTGAAVQSFGAKRAALLSGLGDPARFETQARNMGLEIEAHYAFSDHHWYSASEIKKIAAKQDVILTTEKDAARLLPLDSSMNEIMAAIYVIQAEWRMKEDRKFHQWLFGRLEDVCSVE